MLTAKTVKTEFTNRALQGYHTRLKRYCKCNALVIKLKKTLKLDKKQNN